MAHSRLKRIFFFAIMGPLEFYARVRGIYKEKYPRLPWQLSQPLSAGDKIVCFGDSLTEGFGAKPSQSYPAILQKLLKDTGAEVVNLGVSGETAADGRSRLHRDILKAELPPPRLVVVGFGGNDLMQRRTPEETFRDLEWIVRQLQNAGCDVLLLGLRGSWLYKVDYETPFYELGRRCGCGLIPVCMDRIWGVPWLMSDAAHPNGRGYKLLAERVAKAIS